MAGRRLRVGCEAMRLVAAARRPRRVTVANLDAARELRVLDEHGDAPDELVVAAGARESFDVPEGVELRGRAAAGLVTVDVDW